MPKGKVKNNVIEVKHYFRGIDIENSALVQNFKEGDLLYGFKDVRSQFRPYIENRITSKNITIDDYNNPLLHKFLDDAYYFLPQLKDIDNESAINFLTKEYQLDQAQQEYITHILSHQKLSPRNEDIKPKRAERKSIEDYREEVKLRRLCKAALTWPNKTIHFCLDMLMEEQAITKWGLEKNKIDNGFTDAELRWLYKNWETVKDKVTFYKKGERCEAPWAGEKAAYWTEHYKKGSFYTQAVAEQKPVQKDEHKLKGKGKRLFVGDDLLEKTSETNSNFEGALFDDNQLSSEPPARPIKRRNLFFGDDVGSSSSTFSAKKTTDNDNTLSQEPSSEEDRSPGYSSSGYNTP
jgi:hypothetical protein